MSYWHCNEYLKIILYKLLGNIGLQNLAHVYSFRVLQLVNIQHFAIPEEAPFN